MPKIKILPPDVSNKIAAGEVVERPASVVKELVENAVDAEGTNIQVDIRAGGKRLIRVSDNGIGMSREDALIALERHATSKVGSVEDLQRIQTFGFRGEALPSIASVSQFELLTRTSDALEGTNVTVEGGVVRSVQESGCSPGTHISVNNLFYNVPARLKFLKSENTELNHITNQVHWAALAQPKVQFSLTHNGRSLIDVRACDSYLERILLLYGKDFAENLIEFNEDLPNMQVYCFVGKPDFTKANRNYQLFFLNRRPIRSKIISAALSEAMRSMVPKDRHPVTFLFLTMDAEEVDVNVHPAKVEVRFRNESAIYRQVVQILNSGIYQQKYIPKIETEQEQSKSESTMDTKVKQPFRPKVIERDSIQVPQGGQTPQSQFDTSSPQTAPATSQLQPSPELQPPSEEGAPSALPQTVQPPQQPISGDVPLELFDFKGIQLKTCLFNTYIVAEGKEQVFFIDQHVAAERVLYERFVEQLKADGIAVQGMLLPATIEATTQQLTTFKTHEELFRTLGFDVEQFGGSTIVVRSIPASLPISLVADTVTDLLDKLSEAVPANTDMLEIQDKALVTLACKSAVKAGDSLTMQEMVNLIKDLSRAKLPFNCPHARPIIVEMGKSELEGRFKRR